MLPGKKGNDRWRFGTNRRVNGDVRCLVPPLGAGTHLPAPAWARRSSRLASYGAIGAPGQPLKQALMLALLEPALPRAPKLAPARHSAQPVGSAPSPLRISFESRLDSEQSATHKTASPPTRNYAVLELAT